VATGQFRILFVCHANLCRSPLAERLARRAFDDAFGTAAAAAIITTSAGTRAYAGSPMHRSSADVLAECGVDPAGFVSRTVDAAALTAADLILTATREQRSACLMLAPGAVRKTFTLRQFARFAGAILPDHGGSGAGAIPPGHGGSGTVPDHMRALLDRINATRHTVPAVPGEQDDLPDPVGQPIEAFRVCAEDVWRSLTIVVRANSAA
jgi:protein-tyrosine phosphatase